MLHNKKIMDFLEIKNSKFFMKPDSCYYLRKLKRKQQLCLWRRHINVKHGIKSHGTTRLPRKPSTAKTAEII